MILKVLWPIWQAPEYMFSQNVKLLHHNKTQQIQDRLFDYLNNVTLFLEVLIIMLSNC
jgi:hypothetical protein